MADTLNNYFTTIGSSIAPNISDPWVYNVPIVHLVLNDLFQVENDELHKMFCDIDITKSSAVEHVNSRVLKDAFICSIEQFKYLLNLSFRLGSFHDDWKMASITPLPKDGDLTNCNNCRPSLSLPLPGNIAERIVHNRLMQYFETNELLNKKSRGL